ncbi:MAG TPA: LacI family DNA-binding transcriptional regulator [Capsulimonadaceae bacterium]|nr:LacI family DNA-binding transcriptional regulator [Capsulimonadaceae bacterium]
MNIVEFAKTLNLSIGTVSRALNDRPEVSPKTRQLVLEKARELGFSRNVNARRLVTGRTSLIVLECPQNTHIMSDRYLVEMARAVEEAAGEQGYDLLLHLGTRRHGPAEAQAVDGLIIISDPDTTLDDLRKLTANGRTPAVVITLQEQALDIPQVSYVCLDLLTGVREALERLAALGHRSVGYIGSGHPLPGSLSGLMTRSGLTWEPKLAIEAGITQEAGFEAAGQLLTLSPRPTALFARTDVLASGAVQAARHLKLRVPEDLSVIGHDDIELAAIANPPLTTVAINIPSVAAVAVEMLLAIINSNESASVRHLGTHLIVRQSLGPAPSPSGGNS